MLQNQLDYDVSKMFITWNPGDQFQRPQHSERPQHPEIHIHIGLGKYCHRPYH